MQNEKLAKLFKSQVSEIEQQEKIDEPSIELVQEEKIEEKTNADTSVPSVEEIKDELDVIFSATSIQSEIFQKTDDNPLQYKKV